MPPDRWPLFGVLLKLDPTRLTVEPYTSFGEKIAGVSTFWFVVASSAPVSHPFRRTSAVFGRRFFRAAFHEGATPLAAPGPELRTLSRPSVFLICAAGIIIAESIFDW